MKWIKTGRVESNGKTAVLNWVTGECSKLGRCVVHANTIENSICSL